MSAGRLGWLCGAVLAAGLVLALLRPERGAVERASSAPLPQASPAREGVELRAAERPETDAPTPVVGLDVDIALPERTPLRPALAAADEPLQCLVHGRVSCAAEAALAAWSPRVALTDALGRRRECRPSAEGHYSFADLAPGPWTLTCTAQGFADLRLALELSVAEPILRRDLVLDRAPMLAVNILAPDGRPLEAVLAERKVAHSARPVAVATREPPGGKVPEVNDLRVEHIGVGRYVVGGSLKESVAPGSSGVLVLDVPPPVFVSLVVGELVLVSQRAEAGASEVTFVVDPAVLLSQQASVSLRLVDAETGAPLSGMLEVQPRQTYVNIRDDGAWRDTLPPGRYTLRPWMKGHQRTALELELVAGQVLDLGDVALATERTIDGHLVDEYGTPVTGMLMLGRRDEHGALVWEDDSAYETDETGYFRVGALLPARYALCTTDNGAADVEEPAWVSGLVEVSTLGGSVSGLEVRLVKAGVVVLQGTETLPRGSSYRVLDARGDELRRASIHAGFVPRVQLPPGTCTLVLLGPDGVELARRALVVGAGTTTLGVGD